MPSHLSSPWNHGVSYIEMLFGDVLLSSGTCFFWREAGAVFLVTNWHNLSGLNPATRQTMSPTGGLPNKVRVQTFRKVTPEDADGYYVMDVVQQEIPLYTDGWAESLWRQHSKYKEKVDVAVIDVSAVLAEFIISPVNELEADALLEPKVSQEVFILGYPLGLITGSPSPVWKRGSIASDPTFDPYGLPQIIVDTATRSGMSGSVVLARHRISGGYKRKDGSDAAPIIGGQRDVILGVYSGRLGASELEAQLGIVWKRELISEIIQDGEFATPHA